MNKEIRKVNFISRNILAIAAYYFKFNLLYNLKQVHSLFQTVLKTFLKDKEKTINALQLPYSNAKLEATNNLIKLIKRNAFGFRNFDNFKKRIFIALNIKMERTAIVLSRCHLLFNPLQLTKSNKKEQLVFLLL